MHDNNNYIKDASLYQKNKSQDVDIVFLSDKPENNNMISHLLECSVLPTGLD